jgi:hypothetical protein
MTTQFSPDVVLDVAPEDQEAYVRESYHEYVHAWNQRVQALEAARDAGDLETAARLAEELRHVWPQPSDVATAAWIPLRERERPLASDRGL